MKTKYILLLVVFLFSGGFGFVNILPRFVSVGLLLLLLTLNFKRAESSIYNKAFFVMGAGLFASMLACYFFRAQSVLESFFAASNILQLSLFFYFCRKKVKIQDLAWVLSNVGVIVSLLYLLQYVLFLFGIHLKEVDDSMLAKGEDVRFRIVCSGAIYFAYFQNLYDFMKLKRHSKKNLVIIVLTGTVALIMNFRMILLAMAICSILLLRLMKLPIGKIVKYVIIFALVGVAFFSTDFVQHKIEVMMERQNGKHNFNNDDYARIREWNYYTKIHFQNALERITGSGLPSSKSSYGVKMTSLEEDYGIFYADWGLIGYSWVVGILSVLGMLYYSFIAYKGSKSLPYLNIWFLFMVGASALTAEFIRAGNFMIQALVLAYIAKLRIYETQTGTLYIPKE